MWQNSVFERQKYDKRIVISLDEGERQNEGGINSCVFNIPVSNIEWWFMGVYSIINVIKRKAIKNKICSLMDQ